MTEGLSLQELAELVGGTVQGNPNLLIETISPLDQATENSLTFVLEETVLKKAEQTPAAALLIQKGWKTQKPSILVAKPRLALAKILTYFNRRPQVLPEISETAFVHPTAQIGKEVYIGAFVYIGENAVIHNHVVIHPHVHVGAGSKIGARSLLYAHVTLYDGVKIGKNVILHAGCILGTDGFGFTPDEKKHPIKIPQIGAVVIEDDVEIGSLSTVNRATIGTTTIRRGTKIDDHVHIAHNCDIGEDCVISALVGIAGSVTIGNNVTIAGAVAISGHLTIGEGATIMGRSGVTKNIPPGAIVSGFPAQNHAAELAFQAALRHFAKSDSHPKSHRK